MRIAVIGGGLAIGGGTEEIMNEIIVRALRRALGEHVR
jgi:hypothetical protein